MRLYPFDVCLEAAVELMEKGATVNQQFNCAHCGTKQTMDQPNTFFERGLCERCGGETDIRKNGCNYSVIMSI